MLSMPATPPADPGAEAPRHFTLHAWHRAARLVSVLAQLVHAANLAHLALLLGGAVFGDGERVPPLFLALRLALFSLLPLALVRLLRWWGRATVDVEPERLVLQLRGVRYEIPRPSLDAVRPWKLPLPVPGFSLRMKSGRSFAYGLEAGDPLALLDALAQHGAADLPGTRFAQALALTRRRGWLLALKFGLVPLVVAGIFFRAHQYITYGGPFGQWQMFGLAAYLRSFVFEYWLIVFVGLLLYAALWRGFAEALALTGAWVMPSRARGARRFAEWLCTLAYYVGLPAFILARFFL